MCLGIEPYMEIDCSKNYVTLRETGMTDQKWNQMVWALIPDVNILMSRFVVKTANFKVQ